MSEEMEEMARTGIDHTLRRRDGAAGMPAFSCRGAGSSDMDEAGWGSCGSEDADGTGGGEGGSTGPAFCKSRTIILISKQYVRLKTEMTYRKRHNFLAYLHMRLPHLIRLLVDNLLFLCLFAKGQGVVRIGNLRARTLFELDCTCNVRDRQVFIKEHGQDNSFWANKRRETLTGGAQERKLFHPHGTWVQPAGSVSYYDYFQYHKSTVPFERLHDFEHQLKIAFGICHRKAFSMME